MEEHNETVELTSVVDANIDDTIKHSTKVLENQDIVLNFSNDKESHDLKNSIDAIIDDVTDIAIELKEIKSKVMKLNG